MSEFGPLLSSGSRDWFVTGILKACVTLERKQFVLNKSLIIFVTTLLFSSMSCHISAGEVVEIKSIEIYKTLLSNKEKEGGKLFCEEGEGGKRLIFNSCESFNSLKSKGCYGNSTREIRNESRYALLCREIDVLQKANSSANAYFDLSTKGWWKSLPAEVIPMSGGVYSDASWEKAETALKRMVKDKLLGDLELDKVTVTMGNIDIVIESANEECGVIEDFLRISPVALADFDNDGVAELLLKGYRLDRSDSCSLGSGNSLGAEFSILVKKAGLTVTPAVMDYLNVE